MKPNRLLPAAPGCLVTQFGIDDQTMAHFGAIVGIDLPPNSSFTISPEPGINTHLSERRTVAKPGLTVTKITDDLSWTLRSSDTAGAYVEISIRFPDSNTAASFPLGKITTRSGNALCTVALSTTPDGTICWTELSPNEHLPEPDFPSADATLSILDRPTHELSSTSRAVITSLPCPHQTILNAILAESASVTVTPPLGTVTVIKIPGTSNQSGYRLVLHPITFILHAAWRGPMTAEIHVLPFPGPRVEQLTTTVVNNNGFGMKVTNAVLLLPDGTTQYGETTSGN